MIVKHNLQAMNSNRMLNLTTSVQAKSTEKLSSGYKINRAADDAAGLAISEKMRRQVRGLTQASANAQDGISAVQTAEGALTEVHDMLQRLNELATKSANGTNSQEERDYIQSEVDALIDEIDRVSETTKFNEIYLLKGDPSGAAADKAETVKEKKVSFKEETLKAMEGTLKVKDGADSAYAKGEINAVTGKTDGAAASVAVKTGITTLDGLAGKTGNRKIYAKTGAGTDASDWTEVTDVNAAKGYFKVNGAGTGVELDTTKASVLVYTLTLAPTDAAGGGDDVTTAITGNMEVKAATAASEDTISQYVKFVDGEIKYKDGAMLYTKPAKAIDQFGDQIKDNQIAEGDLDNYFDVDGKFIYTDAGGTKTLAEDADLTAYFNKYGVYKGGLYMKDDADAVKEIGAEQIGNYFDIKNADGSADSDQTDPVPAALEFKLHVGAEGGDATDPDSKASKNKISVKIEAMSAAGIGIKGLYGDKKGENGSSTNGVSTEDSATAAIETIKAAIKKVSQQRSDLGAVQNRLEHTINNLDNIVENTQAAEAQIRDTDIATEMVKYANNNILQQAGTSMLSQANQQNQLALSLLG